MNRRSNAAAGLHARSMDEPSEPLEPPSEERESLPPLRLHHILTWTTITALLLSVYGFMSRFGEAAPWYMMIWLWSFLGGTLAVTVGGFGVYWRKLCYPFPSQPGHGISILWTVAFVIGLLGYLLIEAARAVAGDQGGLGYPQWVITLADWEDYAFKLTSFGLSLWLAWWIRPARRWQVFFVLEAAVSGHRYLALLFRLTLFAPINHLELVGPLLAESIRHVLLYLPSLIPGTALVFALVRDRRDNISRHWSHWAGVIAWCSILPGEIALALIDDDWVPYPFQLDGSS
jgi:hypothetical protein